MTISQPKPKSKPIQSKSRSLRLNSVGTRLFILVMGGALLGLGTMAYFFYNALKQEVEAEIKVTLDSKVAAIDGQMKQAEALGRAFRDSVATLHNQGVKDREVYKKLVFELFKGRPESVIGLGFGQDAYGILTTQQWFYPYYYLDPKTPDAPGIKLPPPNDNVRYIGEDQEGDFYPEQDYWKDYMASQKTVWGPPFPYFGVFYTNFYLPIYNANKKWIGSLTVDLDAGSFNNVLQGSVIRNAGFFAIIEAESGVIVSYPPDREKANKGETYQSIPGLNKAWSQLKDKEGIGLVLVDGTYWAYERLSQANNWIAIAAVPSDVVLRPVLLIAGGGALAVAVLLGGIVLVGVHYLNRRLEPILEECNKLAATDAQTLARIEKEDEIGRLSVSFFNLIDQLGAKENEIRQEVARTVQTQEELKQAAEAEKEGKALQDEVGQLLDIVAAVEEGDFTVQASVSDRITGLVADTFNRLIEELAKVLGQVVEASRQVSVGAENLEQIANTVATNADLQAQEVEKVLQLSEQVEQAAEGASQQIQTSNQSLLALDRTVEDGQMAISALTQGTEVLRQGTDRIVQQMKTLGEFIGLTEQLVQDQNQIATQTQVLALNASLVAARASEQQNPRQFAVAAKEFEAIADQVSKLAQQTNDGLSLLERRTTQIQNVVATVDSEIQNLGGLVGGFTQGVQQSTEAFKNVQAVTASTVEAGEAVAQSSQAIINTVQTTTTTMRGIAELAQRTVQLTQNTRIQSEAMGQLSTQLLERVEFFRLPAQAIKPQEPVDLSEAEESTVDVAVAK